MKESKLNLVNRKGQKIVGVLKIPAEAVRGTCVVQHGWGGNKEKPTIQAMENGCLEAGFQTFNFDTTNSFGESDGDYEQSTLTLHKEDLEDVVKWVQQQDWFLLPLALTGHSMGADAVTEYAEKYPHEVSYLIPVAPTVSGDLSFAAHRKSRAEELEKWEREGVHETVGKDGNLKRKHWFQMTDRLNHDLLPNASRLIMPMLLIVGSRDESCPPDHVRKLFDAIPEGNKKMVLIPDAPHSFYEREEQEACTTAIREWLIASV
jgi:pimeloyl-ACP methyl ester carboxylesterase